MAIFISYSHRDNVFVDRLRTDLIGAGIAVWIDHDGLQPGTDNWEKAIRAAIEQAEAVVYVASENAYTSNYCQGELAIARTYGRKIYPVFSFGDNFVKCIAIDLVHVQYIDMRDAASYAAGLPRLLTVLGIQQSQAIEPITPAEPEKRPVPSGFQPTNPYKGLEAFTAEDRANFFGRSALVRTLIDTVEGLSGERFLAIVGPSGAGKSSVVMAGLIPALRDAHPNWIFLPRVQPGDRPLEALAIMLRAGIGSGAIGDYERDLREPDARGLIKQAKALISKPGQRIILFVDQFEELFTQTPPERESERRKFIDLLTSAALDPHSPLTVILTLRADFTDRALAYDELTRLLQNHTQYIPPLSLADLREVVEEPARGQYLSFDSELAADLVFAVRDQAGALPLLQFTLDQLYQRREGLMLTRAAYNAIGGLRGALARHAQATYDSLPSDTHRLLARWLFLRLIEPGSTDQDTTRRRVARRDLTPEKAADQPIAAEVIDTFIAARLLTGGEKETVEVSHEALIREWARLHEWLAESRDDVRLQRQISQAAAAWIGRGRKSGDDGLYRGTVLEVAEEWAKRAEPNRDEREFLDMSRQRVSAEARRDQRNRRNLNQARGGIVLAIVLIILLAGVFLTVNAQQQADTASALNARSTEIAFEGVTATYAQGEARIASTQVAKAQIDVRSANNQVATAQTQAAIIASTLTPVPLTATAMQKLAQNAQGQAQVANTQIAVANSTLTPIPPTLTAVAKQEADLQSLVSAYQDNLFSSENGIYDISVIIKNNPTFALAYVERGLLYDKAGNAQKALADFNKAALLNHKLIFVYVDRGFFYEEHQQYDKAMADFDQALVLDPTLADGYWYRGNVYYDQQQYDQALVNYTQAIALDPNNTSYYNNRGNLYDALGQYDKAIADYTQAISLDPQNVSAYSGRGNEYYAQNQYDKAIADYTQAIALDPKTATYYDDRGNAYSAQQEYDKALADYAQAIVLDPNNAYAYDGRGTLYYDRNQYDKAIAEYTQAITLDPKNAVHYDNLGNVYYNQNQYDKAIAEYTQAITLDPKNANYYNDRGVSYHNNGQDDQAQIDYTQAITLDPKNAIYYNNRGNIYYNQKKNDKAIADYTQAIKLDPKNAIYYSNRGNVYSSEQQYDEALADYTQAIAFDPKNGDYYNDRGVVYNDQNQYDKALADYTQAIAINPKNAVFYDNRGNVYYYQNHYDKAIADYTQAITLDPKNASYYNDRGVAYHNNGQTDQAQIDYTQAIALDPKNALYYSNRGYVYYAQQQYDKALVDYTQAIALDPKNDGYYNDRGNVYNAQQQYDKAWTDYTQAIVLDPKSAVYYDNRGGVYNAQGQYDHALADYNQAITLDPTLVQGYGGRGLVYYNQGKYAEALADFLKYKQLSGATDADSYISKVEALLTTTPGSTASPTPTAQPVGISSF